MQAVRLTVKGRVQGVGFRHFVYRRAQECGIAGWVKNLPNGDVEAHAEGEPEQLTRFTAALHSGPSIAVVTEVRQEQVPFKDLSGFSIEGWG